MNPVKRIRVGVDMEIVISGKPPKYGSRRMFPYEGKRDPDYNEFHTPHPGWMLLRSDGYVTVYVVNDGGKWVGEFYDKDHCVTSVTGKAKEDAQAVANRLYEASKGIPA